MYICSYCGEDAALACSACKVTRYCSPECQLTDWKTHKIGCKMQQEINKYEVEKAAEPPKRPAKGRCTGCNVKFNRDYPCEDECDECGYQACESCACDTTNGTCYCSDHTFGRRYCNMEPRWYHQNGRTGKTYTGDRHPADDYPEDMYEAEPRACNNCGDVTKVFKKEFRDFRAFSSY